MANLKAALKKITGKEPKESDGGVFSDADVAKALEEAQERLSKTAASLDAGAKAAEDKKPPSPGDDHTREEVCGFVSPPKSQRQHRGGRAAHLPPPSPPGSPEGRELLAKNLVIMAMAIYVTLDVFFPFF